METLMFKGQQIIAINIDLHEIFSSGMMKDVIKNVGANLLAKKDKGYLLGEFNSIIIACAREGYLHMILKKENAVPRFNESVFAERDYIYIGSGTFMR